MIATERELGGREKLKKTPQIMAFEKFPVQQRNLLRDTVSLVSDIPDDLAKCSFDSEALRVSM